MKACQEIEDMKYSMNVSLSEHAHKLPVLISMKMNQEVREQKYSSSADRIKGSS
jgi:hypothetical protein